MAAQLIECVPNFSEGRNRAVVQALEDAVTAVPGVVLLRSEMDQPRSVQLK
jgi:glutamate formiminotransferase